MSNVFHLCVFAWPPFRAVSLCMSLKQNVGLAIKIEAKQVEVANTSQERLTELAAKPGLAALHRDLKVSRQTNCSAQRQP